MLSKILAELITRTLPPEKWYKAAFLFSKYFAYVVGPPEERARNSYRKVQSGKLETLLRSITGTADPAPVFPVSVRVKGGELLKEKYPKGLIIISVHHPLVLLTVRSMLDKGLVPSAIIVKNMPKDGHIPIVGTAARIPVLFSDPTVLLKVTGILRQGGIVIILIDDMANGGYSTPIFRFAKKLKADILFTLAKLQSDGAIEISVFELPDATSSEEDNINVKTNAMDEYVNQVFNSK